MLPHPLLPNPLWGPGGVCVCVKVLFSGYGAGFPCQLGTIDPLVFIRLKGIVKGYCFILLKPCLYSAFLSKTGNVEIVL